MTKAKHSGTRILLKRLIGEGANAHVFEGLRIDGENLFSQRVAVKILRSRKSVDIWRKEFESLAQVRSVYCVQIFGFEWIEERPALIMEFVDGGDLKEFIDGTPLSLPEINSLCAQILRGLRDLRDQGLHHGDLSPENILIDRSGRVRLIDFGRANLNRGTFEFCSPQRLAGAPPSYESDLYSLEQIYKYICQKAGFECSDMPKFDFENIETPRTQLISSRKKSPGKAVSLMTLLALCFSVSASEGGLWNKAVSTLEVRSLSRLHVRIEGGHSGYAPFKMQNIDPGAYKIHWKTPYASGSRTLTVLPGTHIVLGLNDLM